MHKGVMGCPHATLVTTEKEGASGESITWVKFKHVLQSEGSQAPNSTWIPLTRGSEKGEHKDRIRSVQVMGEERG